LADFSFADFQAAVSDCLIRHRSVLDVITKFQEASARVNRAVAKSVTVCGCMEINASKQRLPEPADDMSLSDLKQLMSTHIAGELCADCKDSLETEVGRCLYYLVALCSVAGINFDEVMTREWERLHMLGLFNMN
jgi:hypothetical protein